MLIRQTMTGDFGIDERQFQALASFFERVNGVMFQQQTLAWLAESQFKVHIYGNGWDANSFFARFARGPIDSDTTRLAIYRASRINLAANAYGAVDNRVIEGISAGGFYLMRYCPPTSSSESSRPSGSSAPPIRSRPTRSSPSKRRRRCERCWRLRAGRSTRMCSARGRTSSPRLRSAADAGYTHKCRRSLAAVPGGRV